MALVRRELRSDPAFSRSVLGTSDPREVDRELDASCAARLGSGVGRTFFCELATRGRTAIIIVIPRAILMIVVIIVGVTMMMQILIPSLHISYKTDKIRPSG